CGSRQVHVIRDLLGDKALPPSSAQDVCPHFHDYRCVEQEPALPEHQGGQHQKPSHEYGHVDLLIRQVPTYSNSAIPMRQACCPILHGQATHVLANLQRLTVSLRARAASSNFRVHGLASTACRRG